MSKLKGLDIYISPLTRNVTVRFAVRSGIYSPAMTLGTAAQVAATHCLNERTLDPAVCSYSMAHLCPRQWPSPRNVLRQRLTVL